MLPCLINDKEFEFKEVLRDEKIIYKIIDEEKKFYCTNNR